MLLYICTPFLGKWSGVGSPPSTKHPLGFIFISIMLMLVRRKTAYHRCEIIGCLVTWPRQFPHRLWCRLCTDTTSLALKSLRRTLQYEQIFCNDKTHTWVFPPSVSQLSSTSHWQKSPLLQQRNAAFQNSLAESPRDLFFCSFLILEAVFKERKKKYKTPDKLIWEETNSNLILNLFHGKFEFIICNQ